MLIRGFYNLFGLALSPWCDRYSVRRFCQFGCLDWLLQVSPVYLSCEITPVNMSQPKRAVRVKNLAALLLRGFGTAAPGVSDSSPGYCSSEW